jgi:nucleoid-associated protein YgaU
MGLFDKILGKGAPKKPVDFSNVQSGSSSTAPPPAPAAPPKPEPKTYTVVSGDSLWKIAKREYGDGNKWPLIHEANRDQIKNPDLIRPGQVFVIPELPEGGKS